MRAIKVDGELWADISLALKFENEAHPGRWSDLLRRLRDAEQKDARAYAERQVWGEEREQ